jgi:hypothetical protein
MENKIAKVISYLFHPLLMVIYGLVLLFSINTFSPLVLSLQGKLYVLFIAFIAGVIFPLSFMFFLLKTKVIRSFALETKEERTIPYLMTGVFYYFIFYLFKEIGLPPLYFVFILNTTLLVFITLLINFWWKISAHMIAIGAVIGCISGISIKLNLELTPFIAGLFLVAGLTGFARLKLNAHNNSQLYVGFFTGLICMLILFIII